MTGSLDLIFLRVDPRNIALIKFVFESYEGVAVVRTIDRQAADIVVMVSHDFLDVARGILASLRTTVACDDIPPPPADEADWLLHLVDSAED